MLQKTESGAEHLGQRFNVQVFVTVWWTNRPLRLISMENHDTGVNPFQDLNDHRLLCSGWVQKQEQQFQEIELVHNTGFYMRIWTELEVLNFQAWENTLNSLAWTHRTADILLSFLKSEPEKVMQFWTRGRTDQWITLLKHLNNYVLYYVQ